MSFQGFLIINDVLIGLPWLETRRLVVDRKAALLTLGEDWALLIRCMKMILRSGQNP
ncbi:MAG: hypothetical protein KME54_15230 [Tolypothrix brevis GSE-NOS-MK-07-07A]|jgi:hypothetical protein|nr:hypothetical protein [Tolypothrix brevis GSE-NOS-MK-07-07A]